ncbi:MAG: glutaredoxin family protein [Nitrospirae bacterium]|nr:glutaredoxin family protein [Nitrospirota bacterium]
MYTLSTCVHCKAAKKMLDDCSIKFDFTDIDLLEGKEREDMIAEVKKINERCSFPTILIGDKVIVGFKEDEIRKALGLS